MSAWTAILLSAALKSTVVLGAAWLLALTLRHRSAAARHLVWTAAAAALLALPLLTLSMPALPVRTGALAPFVSSITFRTAAVAQGVASTLDVTPAPHAVRPSSGRAPWTTDFRFLIPLTWAAGAALALAHMAAAWIVMWRMRRTARPIDDSTIFPALAQSLGIEREVALLEIPAGAMPLSFGVLAPAVFLPADARQWSDDRRRVVMLHELAHVRRADLATQLIARAAASLFWWNPLAWMAMREFVKERERAADDLVLTAGESATAYASQLLEIARSMQAVPVLVSAAVAMARPSQLEGRLMAILDASNNRTSTGPRAALAAAVLAIALVAPFAALQAQEKPDPVIQSNVEATIRAAIEQQNHDILDAAAAAYTNTRKYDAAQQLLENSLTIRAKTAGDQSSAYAAGLMKLGDLAAKRGNGRDAVDFYTRAVALGDTPETTAGLLYLAVHSLGRGEPAAAESLIERALAVAPAGKQGRALVIKGDIALANGLPGVAELDYLQALAQAPQGSPDAALAMETYARLLNSQNRAGEAETLISQANAIRQALVKQVTTHFIIHSAAAKVGGGVSAPTLLSKFEPEYTDTARAAKVQGTVVLSVVIGPDGLAHDITLIRGVGFGLDEMAAESVSLWKFAPGRKDGNPVSVTASIEVNFKLL